MRPQTRCLLILLLLGTITLPIAAQERLSPLNALDELQAFFESLEHRLETLWAGFNSAVEATQQHEARTGAYGPELEPIGGDSQFRSGTEPVGEAVGPDQKLHGEETPQVGARMEPIG